MYIDAGSGPRYTVNPARALELWNKTSETLAQIADRFCGANERHVLVAIRRAVEKGGDLARPLPEKIHKPRPPKTRSEFRRLPRPDQIAPVPDNIPRCKAFNPAVEEILANSENVPKLNVREGRREVERLFVGWAQLVVDEGHQEWSGKTPFPWIDHARVKAMLLRQRRMDLWEYLAAAYEKYRLRHCAKWKGRPCFTPKRAAPFARARDRIREHS